MLHPSSPDSWTYQPDATARCQYKVTIISTGDIAYQGHEVTGSSVTQNTYRDASCSLLLDSTLLTTNVTTYCNALGTEETTCYSASELGTNQFGSGYYAEFSNIISPPLICLSATTTISSAIAVVTLTLLSIVAV